VTWPRKYLVWDLEIYHCKYLNLAVRHSDAVGIFIIRPAIRRCQENGGGRFSRKIVNRPLHNAVPYKIFKFHRRKIEYLLSSYPLYVTSVMTLVIALTSTLWPHIVRFS
jgi:hypothetical protein